MIYLLFDGIIQWFPVGIKWFNEMVFKYLWYNHFGHIVPNLLIMSIIQWRHHWWSFFEFLHFLKWFFSAVHTFVALFFFLITRSLTRVCLNPKRKQMTTFVVFCKYVCAFRWPKNVNKTAKNCFVTITSI